MQRLLHTQALDRKSQQAVGIIILNRLLGENVV